MLRKFNADFAVNDHVQRSCTMTHQ